MKRKLLITGILLSLCTLAGLGGWWLRGQYSLDSGKFFLGTPEIKRPLVKYEIPAMQETSIETGEFTITELITEQELYNAYLFEFVHYPDFDINNPKVTTGQINIPNVENFEDDELKNQLTTNGFPVMLLLRGFVSQEIYETGIGSRNGSAYFASNGYITIAPDFLGYAGSDGNAADIFESRFQTYTTALSTLEFIKTLNTSNAFEVASTLEVPPGLTLAKLGSVDTKNTFIWAHSNGGQIALTVLEVTKGAYPTTLWAPVTKGFPYSVLYYTDESIDGGKYIRNELAQFEQLYDTDKFSVENYFEHIQAPVQIHQGGNDDAIPLEWSNDFVRTLRNLDKDVTYYTYPEADHNMRPSWDEVIQRDLEFFDEIRLGDET